MKQTRKLDLAGINKELIKLDVYSRNKFLAKTELSKEDKYAFDLWCRYNFLLGLEEGKQEGKRQLQNEIKSLLNMEGNG